MDFTPSSRTIRTTEKFKDYYSNGCIFCGEKRYKIVDSWMREIQELGGPHRKVIVELEVKTIQCLNPKCGATFTPEHPMYPKNHQFSLDIIEQSLNFAHKSNLSADIIAFNLKINNSVDIHRKTVQSWINDYSEEYFQAMFARDSKKAREDFKAITIDGTWFDSDKNPIGKKKDVHFSSVTKLADGTYLLTWWK